MARKTWRKDDPTKTAVKRQLQAMGLPRYELGLRDIATGRMNQRFWSASEILDDKNLAWLKWMNRCGDGGQGNHIYIRGDRTTETNLGLILVDDLSLRTIEAMEQDGFQQALVIQTSPMNYQVWVRVSNSPLPPTEATAAAQILAKRYGGDLNSADWCHYGRLAGFTNRKPQYIQENGLSPFVLFERGTGCVALQAENLLKESRSQIEVQERPEHQQLSPDPFLALGATLEEEQKSALGFFVRHWAYYAAECGNDESRADWHICRVLAKAGYSLPALHYALRYGSPNVDERKKGHVAGKATAYVDLTISNVLKQPDIVRVRTRLSQQRVAQEHVSSP